MDGRTSELVAWRANCSADDEATTWGTVAARKPCWRWRRATIEFCLHSHSISGAYNVNAAPVSRAVAAATQTSLRIRCRFYSTNILLFLSYTCTKTNSIY